jgi:hypothetical protein
MVTGFGVSAVGHVGASLPLAPQHMGEEHLHIEVPFLTAVHSTDINGIAFKEVVSLDTMSTEYLSFRLRRHVPCDVRLFACVRLSSSPADGWTPWVAFVGHVVATEVRPGHVFRTVLRISHYRFVQLRPSINHG